MPINFVTTAELETLQPENKHFLKGEKQEKIVDQILKRGKTTVKES